MEFAAADAAQKLTTTEMKSENMAKATTKVTPVARCVFTHTPTSVCAHVCVRVCL